MNMSMRRREFFALSAMAGVFAGVQPAARALQIPDPAQPARLRLACQEGVAPGKNLGEKLDWLEAHGFEGFEPGGNGLSKRIDEFQKALSNRKIRISAVCAGFEGCIISENESERVKSMNSMKEILTAAGALGSTGMIMVPAFNDQTKMGDKQARELLVNKLLPELGDHAHKAGTRVLLEPLNRGECYFLRLVADAAAICRDVNNPGLALMGDFWHMTIEEPSDFAAFVSGGKYVHNVHMASRKTRSVPTEDEGDNYVDGFRGLKAIGYQDFVSFECGCKGDRPKVLADAVKLLRDNWAQA